jgi:putative ABC transport system permease protein
MNWLKQVFLRRRMYGELSEEIRAHLDEKVEELVAAGMPRKDAEAAARREFGNVTLAELDSREVWRTRWVENMVENIHYAIRVLLKNPGFAAIAVLTLALGIGANTAIFSVVNAILLRALPFRDPGRLMVVWHTPPQKSFPGVSLFVVSPANYLDWRAQNHVFEQMSPIGFGSFNLTRMGAPETVQGRSVAAGFFSLLGVQPVLGRDFLEEEDQPGRGKVVVISHAFWLTHFGGSRDVLGKQIKLDDQSYTVVGVAPARFDFPFQAQLWMPLSWTEKDRAVRGIYNYLVIARLKNDAAIKKAQSEMDTISARLARQYPADDAGWGAAVRPLDQQMFSDIGPALLVLFGAVGFVLLIACTNVANLTLAKALGRRKEIAVRMALGASRGRILSLVLTETILISVVGGALALLLAHYVIEAIADFIGPQLPVAMDIGLDGWVLGFTLAISIATGVIAGLAPSWHLTRVNLNDSLKQGLGKTDADSGGGRARSVFVGAEVAVSLVLLVGAGLMIRTLYLLKGADSGIDPRNVLTLPLGISTKRYSTVTQQNGFFKQVLEKVRALPGVEFAGEVDSLPTQGGSTQPVQVEGQPVVPMADQPEVALRLISPGYLRAMRIPLKLGRDFAESDNADAKPVVLVSESFAKRFWPRENPIGKHVKLTFLEKQGPCEVVGVVGDVKLNGLGATTPVQAVYHAMAQNPETTFMRLAVRTSLPPTSLTSAVTEAVHRVDAEEPVVGVETMEAVVDESILQNRLNMILLSAFAGLALLLASIGIYGVQAYAVRQRTREFGIRVAMGARPTQVFGLIIGQGLRLTAAGIAVGLAASFGLARLVASQLYGLSPTDPLTFCGVSVVLVLVMLTACLVPARRATRIDPVVALRDE